MFDNLREWILNLTGAAVLTAAAMALTPQGRVKKVVTLVCGFVMIIALLSIVSDFDYTEFSKYMAEYKLEASAYSEDIQEENDRLERLIIEEESAAYILDKGKELGLEHFEADVSAKWSTDGYWYPYSARITSDGGEAVNSELCYYIESELGIARENQDWSAYDGS